MPRDIYGGLNHDRKNFLPGEICGISENLPHFPGLFLPATSLSRNFHETKYFESNFWIFFVHLIHFYTIIKKASKLNSCYS